MKTEYHINLSKVDAREELNKQFLLLSYDGGHHGYNLSGNVQIKRNLFYECQYKRRNTIVNEKYCGVKRVAL